MQNSRHQDVVNHVTATKKEMELGDVFAPIAPVMKGKNTESVSIMSTQLTFTPSQ